MFGVEWNIGHAPDPYYSALRENRSLIFAVISALKLVHDLATQTEEPP